MSLSTVEFAHKHSTFFLEPGFNIFEKDTRYQINVLGKIWKKSFGKIFS